jgi:small subunit ribosomal protein S16
VAVKIKLKRLGKIREPYYRIVVADARTKRDGRAIEEIGKYHPKAEPSFIEVDSERVQHWLSVGAQPTDPVRVLLKITGDWQKFTGEPGAEGTLRTAKPREDKKERFEAAAKESQARKEAKEDKDKGSRAGTQSRAAKPARDTPAKPAKDTPAKDTKSPAPAKAATATAEAPAKAATATADAPAKAATADAEAPAKTATATADAPAKTATADAPAKAEASAADATAAVTDAPASETPAETASETPAETASETPAEPASESAPAADAKAPADESGSGA